MKWNTVAVFVPIIVLILAGCSNGAGHSGGKSGLTMVFSSGGSGKSMTLGAKNLTGSGGLGTYDTFAFALDSWNLNNTMNIGNSTNTTGQQTPLYIYNTTLGPNVSDGTPSNGSSQNTMFMVTNGSGVSTSITVSPLSGVTSLTGTYDEAILNLGFGSATAGINAYDLGPHFNITSETQVPPNYVSPASGSGTGAVGTYGGAGTAGEGGLTFGSVSVGSSATPHIFFVPTSAFPGTPTTTGFSATVTIYAGPNLPNPTQTQIQAAETPFLDVVSGVFTAAGMTNTISYANIGTDPASTYWDGFFRRYCMGIENGIPQLNGCLGQTITFEIIPMTTPLDFGSGDTQVTMNIVYSSAGSSYSISSGTLNVAGVPPLNFSLNVTSQ